MKKKKLKINKSICYVCQKPISVVGQRKRKFCDHCSPFKKGLQGIDYLREQIRMRDDFTCQICGERWIDGQRRFDVHHLDEDLESWDNNKGHNPQKRYTMNKESMRDCITICHKCHLNLDSVVAKMKEAYLTSSKLRVS